jgi:hypothetical protein
MKKCSRCEFEYDDAYDGCPQCAQSAESARGVRAVRFDLRMAVGLAGVSLLFVGAFLPIVSLPFVGSVNYFNNGKGDGIILVGLAAISALLVFLRRHRALLATGGLSVAMLGYSFYTLSQGLAAAQASMEADLAGNPFAGLAEAAMQSVQIQWGWAVLALGALLLLAAGLMKQTPSGAPARST